MEPELDEQLLFGVESGDEQLACSSSEDEDVGGPGRHESHSALEAGGIDMPSACAASGEAAARDSAPRACDWAARNAARCARAQRAALPPLMNALGMNPLQPLLIPPPTHTQTQAPP